MAEQECQSPTSTRTATATTAATVTTATTSTTTTTTTTTTTPPQPAIIDTILSDIAAIVPQFSSIVASYRLLVGAAEEIRRTPGACQEIGDRAIIRADRAGALIDMLLEILCCKISFSTNFLAVTCAPVDLFRQLATCGFECDPSCLTAEQIIQLEILRQALCRERSDTCFDDKTAGPCCKPPPPPAPPPPPSAPPAQKPLPPDFEDELQTEIAETLATIIAPMVTTPIRKENPPD